MDEEYVTAGKTILIMNIAQIDFQTSEGERKYEGNKLKYEMHR